MELCVWGKQGFHDVVPTRQSKTSRSLRKIVSKLTVDINVGDWKSGDAVKRERQVSYIKPLNNPMGPKQTKCNIHEKVIAQDFSSSCVALTTTTTPDVPSGSSFQVMTRCCMMWAGGPTTRIIISFTIEWSKS